MYKTNKIGWATHTNEAIYKGDSGAFINHKTLAKINRTRKEKSSVLICGDSDWTECGTWEATYVLEACHRSPHVCYLITNNTSALKEIVKGWAIQYMQGEWPQNVWLGFTAEDQANFDERWAHFTDEADGVLGRFPDCNVFVSYEPALGPLVLPSSFCSTMGNGISGQIMNNGIVFGKRWLIVGGESGAKARPPHHEWFIDIKNQCINNGVMFHFKQWGAFRCVPRDRHPFGWEVVYKPKAPGNDLLFSKQYKDTPLGSK